MLCSFHLDKQGIEHGAPLPDVPPPGFFRASSSVENLGWGTRFIYDILRYAQ